MPGREQGDDELDEARKPQCRRCWWHRGSGGSRAGFMAAALKSLAGEGY